MDETNTTECPKCGYKLRIGDYPFCKGSADDHVPSHTGVIGDECDVTVRHGICNADGTPRRYTSKSEMAKEAAKRGLENHVVHVPAPGSDKSKWTSRWV